MKKITLLFILLLTFVTWSYSQCTTTTGGLYPGSTVTVLNNGTPEIIANDNWPNAEVSQLDGLIIGNDYTVTGTPSIYITVTETPADFSAIGTLITNGTGPVSFTATTSEILIFWHLDAACGTQASGATVTTIQCTSASCNCTASAAPNAVTNPTPADLSDVVLVGGGTTFAWDESLLGDPADSYTIFIGTTVAADEIGSLANATSGNNITFGGVDNTTYYWKIDAINCAGTTTSAVWSFNSITCPEIAAPACTPLIAPSDNQTGVVTAEADDLSREVNLSWNAIAGADAYQITFDGTALGNTPNTDIDIFGLEYDTSYTWSIEPVNCFGTAATCTTFTFTTEQDPNLSIEDVENNTLKHFYNKESNILTLVSSNTVFEAIELFNILGQSTMSKKLSHTNEEVNLSNLNDGIYLAKVSIAGKTQTIKILKQ